MWRPMINGCDKSWYVIIPTFAPAIDILTGIPYLEYVFEPLYERTQSHGASYQWISKEIWVVTLDCNRWRSLRIWSSHHSLVCFDLILFWKWVVIVFKVFLDQVTVSKRRYHRIDTQTFQLLFNKHATLYHVYCTPLTSFYHGILKAFTHNE